MRHLLLVVLAAALCCGQLLDRRPALAQSPAQVSIEQGRLIFAIGGCQNCHTAKDGEPLAGGDPIVSPFGTFFAPNITPDRRTGIGDWSTDDFILAMREGLSPAGRPLYPAFPFPSYTHMTDADLIALKAYLDTIEPVEQEARPQVLRLPFWPYLEIPFDVRPVLWIWRWLFFEPGRIRPDPSKSEAWNRGAYLVLGPGHCAECHTPRDLFGAPQTALAFTGSKTGPGGESVPNITQGPGGIGAWSDGDLALFLKIGMMPDGDFAGSDMAKIINNGTSKLTDDDRAAIVTYLKDLPPG